MSGNELVAGFRVGSNTSMMRQQQLNQLITGAGGAMGDMLQSWLPTDTLHSLGMISDQEMNERKIKEAQGKHQSDLWKRHEDSIDYDRYKQKIKGGGEASYTGGDPTPLTDTELKEIGLPTSWEKRADFEAQRVTSSNMSPAQKQEAIDGWDDLTRSHHGLPVWSHEQKLDQYKSKLVMAHAEGRLDAKGTEAYLKIFGRPEGKDELLRQEIAKWSGLRVNWLEYLEATGTVESDLDAESRKMHLKQAFGNYGAVVTFNALQKKHGVRLAIRTPAKTLAQFNQAKAIFIGKVPNFKNMTEAQKAHLIQKVNFAKDYEELKAIKGPIAEDYGSSAYAAVKDIENGLVLRDAKLADRRLQSNVEKSEFGARAAKRDWLDYEDPEDVRTRELEETIAKEQRAVTIKEGFAEFERDLKHFAETGEVDPATGTARLNAAISLLKADAAMKSGYGNEGKELLSADNKALLMEYAVKLIKNAKELLDAAEEDE